VLNTFSINDKHGFVVTRSGKACYFSTHSWIYANEYMLVFESLKKSQQMIICNIYFESLKKSQQMIICNIYVETLSIQCSSCFHFFIELDLSD
jgi:hypothetical protein